MAIIIEEQKNRVSIIGLLSWIAVLVVIVVAVYYLFFRNPGKVEVVLPGFQSTQQIVGIGVTPKNVVNNPEFTNRMEYIPPPEPSIVGRDNPFMPF